jgi:radical SAM protein with 4Fe4S-binding SPASM domain
VKLSHLKIKWHQLKGGLPSLSQLPNLIRVAGGYLLTRLTGRDFHWGLPFVLMVEPSSLCNLSCPLCPAGTKELKRDGAFLPLDSFKEILEQIGGQIRLLLLWNQGEPFLNKGIFEMIHLAKQRGIYIRTSTNGHFVETERQAERIIDSGLDEITISMDGADSETYEKYRVGGDFEKVTGGVRLLASEKRRKSSLTPIIDLQMLLTRDTEGQIEEMKSFARDSGADLLSLKTLQITDAGQAERFLPQDESKRRYREIGKELKTKSRNHKGCRRLYYSLVVNSDGKVSPCCFDKFGRYNFGALDQNGSFLGIWRGQRFSKFRSTLLRDSQAFDICKNCSEGLENLYYRRFYL